jgi:hypothetical protein
MYSFIGVKFWGGKSFSEFKKYFAKRIAPDKMKEAFEFVKAEYKSKGYKKEEIKEGDK